MVVDFSAIGFCLYFMNVRRRDMFSDVPRWPIGETSQFLDFCVSLLYRLGVMVAWDDVKQTYYVVK